MTTLEFITRIMKWHTGMGNITLHTTSVWPGLQIERGGPKPLEDIEGGDAEAQVNSFLLDENQRLQRAVARAVEDSTERIETFLKKKGWNAP